jgi:hypothetical protein
MQTCAGVPFEQQLSAFQGVLTTCGTKFPGDPLCGGTLGSLIQQAVLTNLKTYGRADSHKHCSSGNLFVSLSVLDPTAASLSNPKPWTISSFPSVEDMADVVHGTDYISCFMSSKPYTVVRGQPTLDGGYTSSYAQFCPPSATNSTNGTTRCIKLSAFTVGPNNPTGKAPNCNTGFTAGQPPTPPRSTPPAGGPPQNPIPQKDWKLPATCTYDARSKAVTAPAQPPFVPAEGADIHPGFSHNALKTDPCVWQGWSMNVSAVSSEVVKAQFDQGAADAAAWLKANPLSGLLKG